jgi:hypothetical protein
MHPDLWGRKLWTSIHYIALGYPNQPTEIDVKNYYEFFSNLWKVIPCHKCSINYKNHLIELPIEPYLSSNIKLFEWTVLIHNIVNKEIGKKEISVEHALNILKNNQFFFKNNSYIYYSILLSIIIALLIYILIKTKKSWL